MWYKKRWYLEMISQNPQSWQWSPKALFLYQTRRYYKTLSPCFMIGLSNELCTATNPEYIYRMCADLGQKTSTRSNVKNINHIHGHTKNQGQAWPSYFSKVSWQRKTWPLKGETNNKGMMILHDHQGPDTPSQLEAIIPYGSTKTYNFSGLLYLQGFSYPADPLDMVSVEYPILFCQIQDSFATSTVWPQQQC